MKSEAWTECIVIYPLSSPDVAKKKKKSWWPNLHHPLPSIQSRREFYLPCSIFCHLQGKDFMFLSNGTLTLVTFCLRSFFWLRIILHQSEDLHKLLAFRQNRLSTGKCHRKSLRKSFEARTQLLPAQAINTRHAHALQVSKVWISVSIPRIVLAKKVGLHMRFERVLEAVHRVPQPVSLELTWTRVKHWIELLSRVKKNQGMHHQLTKHVSP